ncbi:Polyhomeotic-like protein 3 [Toxocara canis]|uniref:Polyhomeotic-like protein 3 n=1 Tax=Toxocara canis TaxID=6265 RepID=A0A0B2V4J0_TOXCA|nr:Polyhomeotic-like protein 3 [Toxocara canis]
MASGGSAPHDDCPPTLTAEVGRSCATSEPSANPAAVTPKTEPTAANRSTKAASTTHSVRNPKTSLTSCGSATGSMSNVNDATSSSKMRSAEGTTHVAGSSVPQPPKSRRKSAPRAKKDTEETKSKASAQASSTLNVAQNVLPQGPLMLTSAPAGQFMLVHHNGQCFMMPATQYFSTNQQMNAVRPQQQQHIVPPTTSGVPSVSSHDYLKAVHHQHHTAAAAIAAQHMHVQQHQAQPQQQQFVRSSIVSGNATLGQLARSLAPKPPPSGTASGSSSQCSTPTSLTFQAVPTSSVNQAPSSATANIAHMSGQIVGAMPNMAQQPIFQQGIQIRATAPGSTSGIVLQMPNGAYTYVQQVVAPQQPPPVSLAHHQPISAMMNQSASHQQSQQSTQQQHTHAHQTQANAQQQSNEHSNTSNQMASQSAIQKQHSSADNADYASGNKQSDGVTSATNLMPVLGSPSACGVPLNISESPPKATFRGGKQSGSSKAKSTNAVPKVHVPPTITPSNLVPIGAPMPMMVMSTAMPQMGTFAGPAVPVMGPSGQIIHQQLIPAAPMPAHQMIPVFQQQQNIPKFNGAHAQQPQPSVAAEDTSTPSGSPRKRVGEEGTAVDSGAENEPPPLLVQGECKDALDVRVLFMKEADRYYRKAGKKGKIIHLIEGFEIEESDEPFACEPPLRIDDWIPVELVDKIRLSKSPESPSKRTTAASANTDSEGTSEKKGKPEAQQKAAKEVPKKSRNKASSGKDENRNNKASSEKKKRKRKTNELDRLLQMDFGPAQGRLCDILGAPTSEKAKEKKTKELLNKEVEKPHKEERKSEKMEKTGEKKEMEKQERESPKQEEEKLTSAGDVQPEEQNVPVADVSLNSSKGSSSIDQGLGLSVGTSFSDEELDTERCNYCNGLLRLKRCDNHPQYCSKKCRKLWKKNAAIAEEQGTNGSPRQPHSGFTTASSSPCKDLIAAVPTGPLQRSLSTPTAFTSVPLENSVRCLALSNASEPQQRSPPTLTLKMVSPQQAEIVKSPRTSLESAPSTSACSPYQHNVSAVETNVLPPEKPPLDFLQKPARTWTCDEVAKWVASVTGSEDCGGTFRNQDIDGQSLLLLAENPHHNLGTLLGLKLGPVVKIQNALRELAAKSINAA